MEIRPGNETRAILLEAAFTEIHRNGFQAASLSQILADTGLTKGALYHHFPAKHALGLAVIDEVIRPHLEENVFRRLREAPRPVAVLLDILEHRSVGLDDTACTLGCPLNNLVQEMSPVDTEFRHHLGAILDLWRTSLISALSTGQQQGEIKPTVDCEAAGLFILAAWEGCWGVAKNQQSAVTFQRCMTQLRDYVISLIATPSTTDIRFRSL